jgi:ubiquinone/menaquinone biosynthesis C-methylase UbiE
VLELACGSGAPMLELLERGYDVEGLDSSAGMLARCREKAGELGVEATLYHQEMQKMTLPRRYCSIFLAGESFTLLTTDADAREALKRIHDHLLPGGSVLIPLEIPDAEASRRYVGQFKELRTPDGLLLRVGSVETEIDEARRLSRSRLRYERVHEDGAVESLERDWYRSWWTQAMFREMLSDAGFAKISVLSQDGAKVTPDASEFVFLARRS